MPSGTFETIRQKYRDRIATLQQQLMSCQEKLALIDEIEADAAQGQDQPKTTGKMLHVNGAKYNGWELTPAVLDVLYAAGDTGLSVPEIKNLVLAGGLQSNSRHLVNSITTALTRQIGRGKARKEVIGGKPKYYPSHDRH